MPSSAPIQNRPLRFKLRTLAASLWASSLLVASPAFALTVQPIHVLSSLGEPFRAEIVISDIAGIKPDTIRANLANDDEFVQLGINKLGLTRHLQFSTKLTSPERGVITITSDKALNDPYIEFVVHIGFGNNTRLQQVTALVDPPLTRVQAGTLDLPVQRIQLAEGSDAPAAAPAAPSAPILGTVTVTRGVITTPALNMPLKPSRRAPPPMDAPSTPIATPTKAPVANPSASTPPSTAPAPKSVPAPASVSTPAPIPKPISIPAPVPVSAPTPMLVPAPVFTPAPIPAPAPLPPPAPIVRKNKPAAPTPAPLPPPSAAAKPAAPIVKSPAPTPAVTQPTAVIASPVTPPLETPVPVAPPPAPVAPLPTPVPVPTPMAIPAPPPVIAPAPTPMPAPIASNPADSSSTPPAAPLADTALKPSLSSPPPMENTPAPEPTAASPIEPEKPVEPVAPAKPADANADRAYTVRRHDSLWSIASRMQSTTHQSIPVIMQSIKQLNKSAFVAGNANHIRSGAVLIMPSDQPSVVTAPPADQPIHIENEDLDQNKAPQLKTPTTPASSDKTPFTSRGRLPDAKMTLVAPADQGTSQGAATSGHGAEDDKKLNQLNLQISASRQKNLTLGQEVGQLEAQIKANDQKLALQNARLAELMQRLKNRKEAAPKTVKRIATS